MDKALLSPDQIADWVRPVLLATPRLPTDIWEKLAAYVELLGRWNQRMNLTAVRDPRQWVELHVAECLRCAQQIPPGVMALLDFGSGAGLPGIPIALARPEITVTLAESQQKKATFLREAVRVLHLPQSAVCSGRVEEMTAGRVFDVVALRAVDQMERALPAAVRRVASGGWCTVLTTEPEVESLQRALPEVLWGEADRIPGSRQRVILLGQKLAAG